MLSCDNTIPGFLKLNCKKFPSGGTMVCVESGQNFFLAEVNGACTIKCAYLRSTQLPTHQTSQFIAQCIKEHLSHNVAESYTSFQPAQVLINVG